MKSTTEIIQLLGSDSLIAAMEIAHMGCWEWDIKDNAETWSDEQFRIFGYEPGEIEPTYDLFVKALHPEDRDRVLAAVKDTLDGKEPYNIQFRIIRPDKTERIVLAQGHINKDDKNNPERMVGTVLDITELKITHAKLNESRIRLETLINNTQDLICSRDTEGALVAWNSAFAGSIKAAFGVEPFVGMKTVDYLDPQQRQNFNRHTEAFGRVLAGESIREEFSYRLPKGETNFYEIAWSPLRLNNEVIGVAEITRNITDRKMYESEIKKSYERFHSYMEHSNEAVFCVEFSQPLDINLTEDEQIDHMHKYGYVSEANDAWARMAGFERGKDLIGVRLEEITPRSISENITFYRNLIRSRYSLNDFETVEEYKSGVKIHASNTVTGVIENGHLVRIWGTGRDITKQKQMEREMIRSENDLQKLAGRLITHQESECSRIARELHDDLTQQLAVLAIEAGSIEQQFADLPEPVLQKVSHIRDQLIKVSKEVHNLSRDLHPSILDDLGLERAVRSECRNFSSRTGISVMFAPQNIPDSIPKDIALSVYRIIQEGLSNIAKHAETKNAYVFLEGSDHNIILTVRDTGIGFDRDEVREKAALGLGSIRERVRLINGESSILSSPGKGTSIEVKVPLKRE